LTAWRRGEERKRAEMQEFTREIFWNLGSDKRTIVYLLGAAALAIFFFGLYRRCFLWRKMSRIDESFSLKGLRRKIQLLLIDGLFQGRLLRETYPGFMHAFILWGFGILFLGTLTIALQEDITLPMMGVRILRGPFYLYYKLFLNIAGLLALVGILMAFVRRYLLKPSRLSRGYEFGMILLWIFVILVTGFLLEGLRIHSLKNRWEVWSLGGWLISEMISGWSPQESSFSSLHKIFWWSHLFLSFGLIAYIPFSKLLHLITSPANILFRGVTPPGVLVPIRDFSEPYAFGVSEIKDFTPRQMFDLDACTECGRCQDNCPAHLSEKPLSPKKAIKDLKERWLQEGKGLRRGQEGAAKGELLDEEVIWACTMCMACMENCPVYISCYDKIIDLRRSLVLMRSRFFPEIGTFFRNVETFGDTFGKGRAFREDWALGTDVKKIAQGDRVDYLYWVGCQGAFHDRSSLLSASLVRLLKTGGVDFGILGKEEICCGDPVRRIGNEYLFQGIARKNIECPHCFNMLKNEYPQFGGQFEVIHYTELLRDLIVGGQLKINKGMERRVIYHDPCYLSRANGHYRKSREILASIPEVKLLEPVHSKRQTFCCGAGGGHMWMREIRGKKINEVRLEELCREKPEVIASSCPYCLVMFEDGVKSLGIEGVKCLDLIEMVRDAI
jgi:Fe-S oxidoreductase/nitrate reductase gamma subunit